MRMSLHMHERVFHLSTVSIDTLAYRHTCLQTLLVCKCSVLLIWMSVSFVFLCTYIIVFNMRAGDILECVIFRTRSLHMEATCVYIYIYIFKYIIVFYMCAGDVSLCLQTHPHSDVYSVYTHTHIQTHIPLCFICLYMRHVTRMDESSYACVCVSFVYCMYRHTHTCSTVDTPAYRHTSL